jgi:hypothetical protein
VFQGVGWSSGMGVVRVKVWIIIVMIDWWAVFWIICLLPGTYPETPESSAQGFSLGPPPFSVGGFLELPSSPKPLGHAGVEYVNEGYAHLWWVCE